MDHPVKYSSKMKKDGIKLILSRNKSNENINSDIKMETRSAKKGTNKAIASSKTSSKKRITRQNSNNQSKKIKTENNSKCDSSNSESSFSISITCDENSPSKLNLSQLNLNDESKSDQLITNDLTLVKRSVFDRTGYEVLEELPDSYDYKDVHLKDNVFYGYEEQKKSLHFLINNAIGRGESGTVLIYGGPGSGKTSFVNTCLKESDLAKSCRIIKLNGSVHGNDVSTIHYIAKSLEIKFNDLPRIVDQLKDDYRKKNANLIIVLDKFDLFCDDDFLLYNFFDLIQYVGYIMVIGISTRYDCIELLEKRIKSRMNHKIIDLKPPFETLGQYLAFAKNLLSKDVKFTKAFQHNLEIQFSKSYSIAELKVCLVYNMRSRKAKQSLNGATIQRFLSGKDEKVSLICNYLTILEISVLLLAGNLIYNRELERFNCNRLLELIDKIPTNIACNQKLLFMAVGVLIDYDLFVIDEKKTLLSKKLYLTEWTPLVLNVFRFQIEESLNRLERRLPTGVAQLFKFQN